MRSPTLFIVWGYSEDETEAFKRLTILLENLVSYGFMSNDEKNNILSKKISDSKEIIDLLIKKGADLNQADHTGATAADLLLKSFIMNNRDPSQAIPLFSFLIEQGSDFASAKYQDGHSMMLDLPEDLQKFFQKHSKTKPAQVKRPD